MATLIKDLIEIPEVVHKGDFVLKLSDGVSHRHDTLKAYVVTDQLAGCFDKALGLIKSATEALSSKAAYLHGSFGSGKSHFMAVLHLLLQHDAEARSVEGLEAVVAKYGDWIEGKRFLLVPYHMIGATSMEAAIFGGYLDHVRSEHPEAPLPAVHRADGLLANAKHNRENYGDEAFFKTLNQGGGGDNEGWGDMSGGWDAESYERAAASGAGSADYDRLVSDLIRHVFPGHADFAGQEGEGYIALGKGLSVMSRHAKFLGYDGLILFLDELILWLASKMADHVFVSSEAPKLANLVETAQADRALPIVSFVARQRDLREFLGEHIAGSEQFSFIETLKHWEGRFETITLADQNLPVIAERRVLKPRSPAAKQEIDEAFEQTKRVRQEVMDVLRAKMSDPMAFRRLYPFSPVFLDALVAVSSVLQRERTALKILMLILSQQRDTLELGQVVPVGDLWDVIADGDEPFSAGMAKRFDRAKQLYFRRLQPLLEQSHGMGPEEVQALPATDARKGRWRADDRLMKTLLLAALVPDVDSLRDLTAAKLSALNHGSFRAPIAGREAGMVLSRVREWAGHAGEVKVSGDPTNPLLSIHLAGVDTEAILDKARNIDNTGNRRIKIRDLLFRQLGVKVTGEFWNSHSMSWRGTRRQVDVVFGNVRELPVPNLENDSDTWKLVIDFPFDEGGYSPLHDIAKIEEFRSKGKAARTLCWIPSFLGHDTLADLGRLVSLDHILTGDRFVEQYANDMPASGRAEARVILQGQRDQLESKLISALESAYGISTTHARLLDSANEVESPFNSLDPGFTPRSPVAANLAAGLHHFVDQALQSQFPAHPDFGGDEVRIGRLRKVHAEVMRAVDQPDGRIEVEKPMRADMAGIGQVLHLGQMGDGPFVLGNHWQLHFVQCQARTKDDWTVGNLRAWMEEPKPMGLPREFQNLIILAFAGQTDRTFFQHGGPAGDASLEKLSDELELREQPPPDAEEWKRATAIAGEALGVAASPLANAGNVAKLIADIEKEVVALRGNATRLLRELDKLHAWLPSGDAARVVTARSASELMERLHQADGAEIVSVLANTAPQTSAPAVGTSLRKAEGVAEAIKSANWKLFEAVRELSEGGKESSSALIADLAGALAADEYAVGLGAKLKTLADRAVEELKPPSRPKSGRRVVSDGNRQGLAPEDAGQVLEEIRAGLERAKAARLDITWRIEGEDA